MNIRRSAHLFLVLLVSAASLAAEPQEEPAAERWSPYTLFRKPPRAATMVVDGFLWIEAEDFADYGDWRLDTQFVQQMGSAYLIAAGVGRPIADAATEVQVPRAGRYRLWVRAKNWIREHAPGKFAVSVNGVRAAHVFGAADSEAWIWESAGEFDLPAGAVKLALHDLTGYFGRCDALLLTRDLEYTPPSDLAPLQQERSRLSGVSLEPAAEGEFDVVVVGAGAAGCCAAVAAARLGANTALIQNRPVLGGNASDELGVGICGASVSHPNARESGIMEEAGRIKAQFGWQRMSEGFRMVAEGEKSLKIFYNRHVVAATLRDPQHIDAVTAVDTLTGQQSVFRGKLFIDCTGDGWVGYYAGAKYRLGRESRDEFGEDLAPPQADNLTMSGCIMGNYTVSFRAKRVGRPVAYVPPPWAAKLPPPEEFGRRIDHIDWGDWWLEHPGEIDDLWDPERARDELLKISFGYWDFIKNRWPERDQAQRPRAGLRPLHERQTGDAATGGRLPVQAAGRAKRRGVPRPHFLRRLAAGRASRPRDLLRQGRPLPLQSPCADLHHSVPHPVFGERREPAVRRTPCQHDAHRLGLVAGARHAVHARTGRGHGGGPVPALWPDTARRSARSTWSSCSRRC